MADSEARQIMGQFGVAYAQVERDHVLSHVLAALSESPVREELVFIGGTALARTHLPDLRLSEDIDLIALGRRSDAARMTTAAVTARLRRSHGDISWRPPLTRTSGSDPATMIIDGRIPIQIQLLASAGQPSWPTVISPLEQRYSDAAPAQLRTLTPAAFVAAKTMAWVDPAAPRDLYDLWAMRNLNMINSEAAELYRRLGPTGALPGTEAFAIPPSHQTWQAALAHQARIRVGPTEAAQAVLDAWDTLG